MSIRDGASCPGCGLANYEGLCPHCHGDAAAYEDELVPFGFPSLHPDAEPEPEYATELADQEAYEHDHAQEWRERREP